MGGTRSHDEPGPDEAVRPARAPVVPRVRPGEGGEALPIHDHVNALLRRGVRGLIRLDGPPGSGKSTALRHLAEVLPPDAPVSLMDDVGHRWATAAVGNWIQASKRLCVAVVSPDAIHVGRLEMVPWGDDDLIEYLLANHRRHCQAVMTRVKASPRQFSLGGSPELWRMVVDTLVADETIPDVPAALRRRLSALLSDPSMTAGALSLAMLRNPDLGGARKVFDRLPPPHRRLVQLRPVQIALASELIVRDLCDGVGWSDLEGHLPQDLIAETARLAAHWPAAVDRLAALAGSNKRRVHPMAVSVLLAVRPEWRPDPAGVPTLNGAYAAGAHWAGVDLHGGEMVGASLDRADLSGANLQGAWAWSAGLSRATLRGARLENLRATDGNLAGADLATAVADGAKFDSADLRGADFRAASLRGADFTVANLSRAILTQADLSEATFVGTDLTEADMTGADLSSAVLRRVCLADVNFAGTVFREAELTECALEGASLPGADFEGAKLRGNYLTATRMPGANFRRADLRNTGLAEVEWPGADLREADLRGASFHLGSTRSGLVGSAIPCEGSKTGFYTDDFHDRDFKSPEEIRKANLCGADLRGARTKGVDFYLVDLRGAHFTDRQERQFRRCGAILDETPE
jgi:uncharacterized protein YjbI with pentapeptide repeats